MSREPVVSHFPPRSPDTPPGKRPLGFVLIGRNEGERLIACFKSVAGKGSRVVYVDSGSSDGSVERMKALGAETVLLDMNRPFTAARARNTGFHRLLEIEPDTRWVQFVDGDCLVADDWVDFAQRFLEANDHVAIVCGRRQELHPEASIYNRLCNFEWDTPIGDTNACGGDFLARVHALRSVGGFDDSLIAGEEPELCYRLRRSGWRIHRADRAMTHHDAAIMRFSQWAKRTVRAGYAYAAGAALHFRDGDRYCMKENLRILFWGCFVPVAILLLSVAGSLWFLLLLLVYPLQFIRILVKFDPRRRAPGWKHYCLFLVLCKWPEFGGQLLFAARRLSGRDQKILEYK
jgi:GT2 family glycosyltransferase